MARYALRRFLQAVPLLLGITLGIFLLIRLVPGGPLSAYEGNPDVTAQDLARLHSTRARRPAPRAVREMARAPRAWGAGLVAGEPPPVASMIGERLGNTAYLMGLALVRPSPSRCPPASSPLGGNTPGSTMP